MLTLVSKHLNKELRGTVDHKGLPHKALCAGHIAVEIDDSFHPIQIAYSALEYGQKVDRGDPRCVIGILY